MVSRYTLNIPRFLLFIVLSLLSTSAFSNCDDTLFAGVVGNSQTLCSDDDLTIELFEIVAANGGSQDFEYLWIFTYTNPTTNAAIWAPYPGATQKDFTFPDITQNTWLRRCVREAGCDLYMAESNIVAIQIQDCYQNCEIETNIDATDISCAGGADGYLKINPSNGLAPYTYAWSNGSTTQTQYNLTPASYSVTVTDLAGCEAIVNYELTAPEGMEMTYDVSQPDCYMDKGSIALDVNGGVLPYTYEWNGAFINSASVFGLDAGMFTVVVTDANGCSIDQIFNIEAQEALAVSSNVTAATCSNDNGAVELNVSGGVAPYEIEVEDENGLAAPLMGMSAGTYTAHIYDANDCYQTLTFIIALHCGDSFSMDEIEIAQIDENQAIVSWTVTDEPSEVYYIIERSHDQINFETIGTFQSSAGVSMQNDYLFTDKAIKKGIYQYKIKALIPSMNITKTISATIRIITNESIVLSTYPNPAINELRVDFLLPTTNVLRLQLVNAVGNLEYDEDVTEGTIVQSISIQHLKPGIYYINLIGQSEKSTTQLFIKS